MHILAQAALGAAAAIGVTVAVTQPSTPAEPNTQEFLTCIEAAAVLQNINSQHPVAAQVTLDPEQTKRVVAWYNAQEPVADTPFDLVIVLRHASGQFGLLVGIGDKVCETNLVPAVLVPALLRAIAGHSA